jgi:FkbM family methyltransferase
VVAIYYRFRRFIPNRLVRIAKAALLSDPSESGETFLLRTLARNYVLQPWIIDVGANDGVTVSNSLHFIESGWRAVLVEPSPAAFRKLVTHHGHRKNVTCIEAACYRAEGEARLFFGTDGEDGLFSTLCLDDNDWFRRKRTGRSTVVRVRTITSILAEAGSPARPGILSLDCEGVDYEALCGLDFALFRPTVIVTEEYDPGPAKQAEKYSLLLRNDYTLVQKIGCNTVWIDRGAEPSVSAARKADRQSRYV